ncbi:MAG: hypothetical protein P9L99_21155 [Candidatus Lernaella stagnicola]|nr:hypothetical protein [Candidatus Lernaella stagnicola]
MTKLTIDGKSVDLNEFTAAVLAGALRGAVGALHGIGAPDHVVLTSTPPRLEVDGTDVTVNAFARAMLFGIVRGAFGPLKGVAPDADFRLEVS